MDEEVPNFTGIREIQKNRKDIKVSLQENTLIPYLLNDLWQIIPFARTTGTLQGRAFYLIVRIAEGISEPFAQGVQNKVLVPLLDVLKPISQKGWLFLTKQELNLLSLLRQLVDNLLKIDFSHLEYSSKDLLNQFEDIEKDFLCLKFLSPSLVEFSEGIRKAYQNIPDLPGSISGTVGLVEKVLNPSPKGPSLESLIVALNIVKYRKFFELEQLFSANPGVVLSLEEFDVLESVQTEIRKYLKDCEAKVAVLSKKRENLLDIAETRAQNTPDDEDLIFFYEYTDDMLNQAHTLLDPKTRGMKETEPHSRSFARDKVFPLVFLLRFITRFLEVIRPILSDIVPFTEGKKIIFTPDVFGNYLEKIEKSIGNLAKSLQTGVTWNYQEYLVKRNQEVDSREPEENRILQSIESVVQSIQMISSILGTIIQKHTPPKGTFTPGPVNQRHLSGETLTIPYLNENIEQRDVFMGKSLGECLFSIQDIMKSFVFYFQPESTAGESNGLTEIEKELFALSKTIKRIGTPEYYQKLRTRYGLV